MPLQKIRILTDQTINKIAAGEVIENPSSVVKELVENSLDAGASEICVEIQEGGRQLIRVSDNGCGMNHDDALLCLERHATSKIQEVEDIQNLDTMGFRGEAIPSIAAISKFSLFTALKEFESSVPTKGTLILVEGGRIISCASAPKSAGTTIEVKSLFFNVPVRRNFQKSPSSDVQEVLRILTLLALSNPRIQFELINDQKVILKTVASQTILSNELLIKRIENILGKDLIHSLIPIQFSHDLFQLEGFIGKPNFHKPNRIGQYIFINQRAVSCSLIASAIKEGYGTMLPTLRFPFFILHFKLPGHLIDVNVHPQKKEVRLRQEFQIKEAIIKAVQNALRGEQSELQQVVPFSTIKDSSDLPPFWGAYVPLSSSNENSLFKVSEAPWEFKDAEKTKINESDESQKTQIDDQGVFFSENPSQKNLQNLLFQPSNTLPRVIDTIAGFVLVESFNRNQELFRESMGKIDGGLALIDQRAAYSRIYYEQLLNQSISKELQSLLIPMTLEFSFGEAQVVRENLFLLNKLGFNLREFGEKTFVIDTIPEFIKGNELKNCLSLLIQDLIEMNATRRLQAEREKALSIAACRASIPTSKRLSIEDAQGLVKRLMECQLPAQCPMGKPTCIYFSPEEIGKWFQKSC